MRPVPLTAAESVAELIERCRVTLRELARYDNLPAPTDTCRRIGPDGRPYCDGSCEAVAT